MIKGQKGITLVALVITIIVMLILAGVTISIVINGGLFNQASEATTKTNMNAVKADAELAVVETQALFYDNVTTAGTAVKNQSDVKKVLGEKLTAAGFKGESGATIGDNESFDVGFTVYRGGFKTTITVLVNGAAITTATVGEVTPAN